MATIKLHVYFKSHHTGYIIMKIITYLKYKLILKNTYELAYERKVIWLLFLMRHEVCIWYSVPYSQRSTYYFPRQSFMYVIAAITSSKEKHKILFLLFRYYYSHQCEVFKKDVFDSFCNFKTYNYFYAYCRWNLFLYTCHSYILQVIIIITIFLMITTTKWQWNKRNPLLRLLYSSITNEDVALTNNV